jgi:Predicted transcriptional regulators
MPNEDNEYNVQMIGASKLETSSRQPPSRMGANNAFNQLKNSIKAVGLQYPPLVYAKGGDKYVIIDGHRRIACCRELGWPQIPVMVTVGKPDDLFAAVSGNVLKMKASEWVHVYLSGGMIPSGVVRTCIVNLERLMGKEFLERLSTKGASPTMWNVSGKVVKYLSYDTDDEKRKSILEWLLNVGTRDVAAWMQGENAKTELEAAFRGKRAPTHAEKQAA